MLSKLDFPLRKGSGSTTNSLPYRLKSRSMPHASRIRTSSVCVTLVGQRAANIGRACDALSASVRRLHLNRARLKPDDDAGAATT